MWGLSVQFWQSVVSWANIVALVGGVLAVPALFVSAWVSKNIADVVQQDADRRITEARTRGDEARADAAKANERASAAAERAAEAEARAAELQLKALELQKQLEARDIDFKTFPTLVQNAAKFPTEILYAQIGTDTFWLASRTSAILGSLGWHLVTPIPQPIVPDNSELCKFLPPLQCMGGQPFGVTVLTHDESSAEEVASRNALQKAFAASLPMGAWGSTHDAVPKGIIRILVGPKT
jgi:hypothetical protein